MRIGVPILILGLLATAGGVLRRKPSEVFAGKIIVARDEEGRTLKFRIDSTEQDPRDADGEVVLYGVSVFVRDRWQPYCGPDLEGRSRAIPVLGSWDPAQGRLADAGQGVFTLACTSGAIGKCIRFGYKPWKTASPGGGVSFAALHEACVRMVRADYCGDGRSHTVNGTRIDIYDRFGIQKEEPNAGDREEFEAAWGANGATFLRVPRWSDDVRAVISECPKHFMSRTSLDRSLSPQDAVTLFPETLLFNNRMRDPKDRMMK